MTDDRRTKAARDDGSLSKTVSNPAAADADVYHALPDCEERRMFDTGHCFTPEDLQAQINEFLFGNVSGVTISTQDVDPDEGFDTAA